MVEVLRDTLIRVVGRIPQLELVVSVVSEPGAEISTRQPSPPAYLQHLVEVEGVHRHCNGGSDQDAKGAELAEEFTAIERLECIIEGIVPCVDPHADVNLAKIERHYGEQKPPGPTISPPRSNKISQAAMRRALSDVLPCHS